MLDIIAVAAAITQGIRAASKARTPETRSKAILGLCLGISAIMLPVMLALNGIQSLGLLLLLTWGQMIPALLLTFGAAREADREFFAALENEPLT